MLVSTQQTCAESNLSEVINSNISLNQSNSINRLKRGLKPQSISNKNAISTYENDFLPRQLTKDEKRHIFETTLKLGNMAFFNDVNESNIEFNHAYSLRYITISDESMFYTFLVV